MIVLVNIEFIVDSSFLLAVEKYYDTFIWPSYIQIINPLSFEFGFLTDYVPFLYGYFQGFFFIFSLLNFMSDVSIDFFWFILFGVCSAYSICDFMPLTKFEKFHSLFYEYSFSLLLSSSP